MALLPNAPAVSFVWSMNCAECHAQDVCACPSWWCVLQTDKIQYKPLLSSFFGSKLLRPGSLKGLGGEPSLRGRGPQFHGWMQSIEALRVHSGLGAAHHHAVHCLARF